MTVSSNRSNLMDFNYLQRVKVYRLNDGGKWDDKGTGHVSLEYLERSEAVGLVVIDEENNQTLLIHRISADDIYRRQEDTIISWTDPEVATDLALSFQETMSCSYIWDQICSVQRSIQFPSVGALDPVPRPINDDLERSGTCPDDDDAFRGGGGEFSGLPPVELSTLPQLVKAVAEVPHFDRDRVAALILREPNYIRKIIDLFKVCEDLENLEGLHMMFKIVKGIISLNDHHIFDDIFGEEYIMDIVGALEYDPELPAKQEHRAFLKDQVVYKEVVPIRDPTILAKIHQTYRIGFIKDVILPRVLDDQTFATFNSIMLFNNVAVVSALQNNNAFISELFSKLWSPNTTERGRKDLILFVQEFCNLSKHLQPGLRNQLLGSLVNEGLFDIVTNTLQSPDETVRLSGSDILVVVSNHSPPLLRAFLVQQQDQTLFTVLIRGMLTPGEGGLQSQLLEIMRMLLDSDTMDPAQTDKFLDVFYEKYIDQLVEVLTAGCPPKGTSAEYNKQPAPFLGGTVLKGDITPEFLMSICELMCFCVLHHRFRIKYYVMRNNVVEKILRLTRRREKYLVVAAVRFLRTCIALKDEFYNRYLVKNNLFQPVIQSFLANGNRYNLLNSAVLELFDFVRKENITLLMSHLIENFSDKLDGLSYAETFQTLKLKYEQSLEMAANFSKDPGSAAVSGPIHSAPRAADRVNQIGPMPDLRKRKDERALDKDEEDYFNEDSDEEEDTASAHVPATSPPQPVIGNGSILVDVPFRGGPFGLVDYEDEDEDAPSGLGSSKEGSSDRKPEGVLLPPLPISDPIWPEMEEVPVKRKISASLDSQDSENATAVKRRRPKTDDGNSRSDLTIVREGKERPTQAPLIHEAPSVKNEAKAQECLEESEQEMKHSVDKSVVKLETSYEVSGKDAKRPMDKRLVKVELSGEDSGHAMKQSIDESVEEKSSPKARSPSSTGADDSGVSDGKVSVDESYSKETRSSNANFPTVSSGTEQGTVEQKANVKGQESPVRKPTVLDTKASDKSFSKGRSPGTSTGVSNMPDTRPSDSPPGVSKVTDTTNSEWKSQSEVGQPLADSPGVAASGAESPNGHESRKRGCDCVSEKETTGSECNGLLEDSDKIVVGPKESSPQHLISVGSDTKLASLGSEILRGGTQPSPGPYTVR
ncbi:unnamed protein product [Calypogeia fissa]